MCMPRYRMAVLLCLLLSLFCARPLLAAGGDWAMFRHDAQHSGRSTLAGALLPVYKWKFYTGSYTDYSVKALHTAPVVAPDGTIYQILGTTYNQNVSGGLLAINPDGSLKWFFPTNGASVSTPALGEDGTIYYGATLKGVPGKQGIVYAVNPNGTLRWSYQTERDIRGAPTISSNGDIFINEGVFRLHAFTAAGVHRWAYEVAATYIYGSPAISNDGSAVYVYSSDGKLTAINTADSTLLWIKSLTPPAVGGGFFYVSPVVGSDGTIYLARYDEITYGFTYYTTVHAYNPDGSVKATANSALLNAHGLGSLGRPVTPAIGTDGALYTARLNNSAALTMERLSIVSGAIVSTPIITTLPLAGNGEIYSTLPEIPAVTLDANNLIFWASNAGVFVVDPATNSVLAQTDLGVRFTTPVTIGPERQLYVGSNDGYLYAFKDASNTPPVALDGSCAVVEGLTFTGTLHASDVDDDPLTFRLLTTGAFGEATIIDEHTGAFQYHANLGEVGTDSFTFVANDGKADSIEKTITVTIAATLQGVNLQIAPAAKCPLGTTAAFSAQPIGGLHVQYKFQVQSSVNREVVFYRGFTDNPEAEWTPEDTGRYTVMVFARDLGGNAKIHVVKALSYTVNPVAFSTLALVTDPGQPSPRNDGAVISLTVTSAVPLGDDLRFWFRAYEVTSQRWVDITPDFQQLSTVFWLAEPGRYYLYAYTKDISGNVLMTVKAPATFLIYSEAWTNPQGITLSMNPAQLPLIANSDVTITASLTAGSGSGVGLRYWFQVYNTTTRQWTGLSTPDGYQDAFTALWHPIAGKYQLAVTVYDPANSLTVKKTTSSITVK